jgi:hypothetical protein
MKMSYLLLALSTCCAQVTDIPCVIRTIPPDTINAIICVSHSFYNGPRHSADKTAWNVLMNYKECAQWDELDYWYAIHQISSEYKDAQENDFRNYFAGGYVFCILESVRIAVIQQWKLYDFPAFWKFLRSCPDYQDIILSIYEIIKTDNKSYNQLTNQSYKMIVSEYQKIKTQYDEKNRIFTAHAQSQKEVIPQEE